MKNYKFLTIFG